MAGKVVMITGAARGIGASIARLLQQRGARLVLIDIDDTGLRNLARDLGDDTALCITCDVTDFDGMQAAATAAVKRFGGIDVVVANAGIEQWAPVRTVEPNDFQRVIDTNIIGVFNTVRASLASVVERRGYVLVVGSVSSYSALPGMASYAASKAGIEQFANVLRMELSAYDVGVGLAQMSLVDTPMLRETQSSAEGFVKLIAALPPSMRRPVTADTCAERLVDAIDHRRRFVDVPRWVAAARWLKPLLSLSLAQRPMTRRMKQIESE